MDKKKCSNSAWNKISFTLANNKSKKTIESRNLIKPLIPKEGFNKEIYKKAIPKSSIRMLLKDQVVFKRNFGSVSTNSIRNDDEVLKKMASLILTINYGNKL